MQPVPAATPKGMPCPAPGRFHDIRYYHCMGSEYKHLLYKEQQKLKYCTPKQETVTKILEEYKVKSLKHVLNINKTLRSLSQRNVPEGGCPALPCPALPRARFRNESLLRGRAGQGRAGHPEHTNLFKLISSVPLLIQSYQKIRKNDGAMTAAAAIPPNTWESMNPLKRKFLLSSTKTPDGISLPLRGPEGVAFFHGLKTYKKGPVSLGSKQKSLCR